MVSFCSLGKKSIDSNFGAPVLQRTAFTKWSRRLDEEKRPIYKKRFKAAKTLQKLSFYLSTLCPWSERFP